MVMVMVMVMVVMMVMVMGMGMALVKVMMMVMVMVMVMMMVMMMMMMMMMMMILILILIQVLILIITLRKITRADENSGTPRRNVGKRGTLLFVDREAFDVHVVVGINSTAQQDVFASTVHYSSHIRHHCIRTVKRPTG